MMEDELITSQQGAVEMEDTLYTGTTACDHYMVWESNDIAVCDKGCGHGCMVNPNEFEIRNGKIVDSVV